MMECESGVPTVDTELVLMMIRLHIHLVRLLVVQIEGHMFVPRLSVLSPNEIRGMHSLYVL